VSNDPAWDMPLVNWRQQGSYVIRAQPPEVDPDAGDLVCLPPISREWLPIVEGCLDQLCNPSSWAVADDTALGTVLSQASRLKQMFSQWGDCVSLAIRFDGETCQLQQSTDSGATWVEVEGWDSFSACLPPQTLIDFDSGCTLNQSLDGGMTYEPVSGWVDNFSVCVQGYTPIIGLPPNPGDKTPSDLACAIAKYLAEQVIIAAMGKAVTAIQDDLTLLQFGLDVVNIIPEFVLVTLAADAFSGIYAAVQEGTLSDFEDALTDTTLLSDIICAIYSCIFSDGYVKPSNFSCITAAIAGISYAHSDVVAAIGTYLDALGAVGLAQLSQVAGLESGEDCSSCGDFCRMWDFTASASGWGQTAGDPTGAYTNNSGTTEYRWQGESQPDGFGLDISTSQYAGATLYVRLVGVNFADPAPLNPYREIVDPVDGTQFPFTLPSTGDFDVTVDTSGHVFTAGFRYINWSAAPGNNAISRIYAHTEGEPAGGNGLRPCTG